jgi:hypothetical protein
MSLVSKRNWRRKMQCLRRKVVQVKSMIWTIHSNLYQVWQISFMSLQRIQAWIIRILSIKNVACRSFHADDENWIKNDRISFFIFLSAIIQYSRRLLSHGFFLILSHAMYGIFGLQVPGTPTRGSVT